MKVEISETTYEAIAAVEPDVSAFVERAARRELGASAAAPRIDTQVAIRRLTGFREVLTGVSTNEFVEDCRQGRDEMPLVVDIAAMIPLTLRGEDPA